MKAKIRTSSKAIAIMLGTIVGVGIFGLPYAFVQSGFLIGAAMLILFTGIFLYLHLLYGEIVLRTRRKKRLVGYAKKYLGIKGKVIASVAALFGLIGAQLAYLIIGSRFLFLLFQQVHLPVNLLACLLIFFSIGSLVVLKGTIAIANSEFWMSLFLIAFIVFIFTAAWPHIETSHLTVIRPEGSILAYGVMLFALSGLVAIPELIEYLKKKRNSHFKRVIRIGTLLPAFLYFLFVIAIVGIAGTEVSQSAIGNLQKFLGANIFLASIVFGILAVLTSFITIGINLTKILWYDYHLPKTLSWLIVSLSPLVFYFIGLRNFIGIISTVGAIMGGINGILIIAIFQKARQHGDQKPAYTIKLPKVLKWGFVVMFLGGIVYQLFYLF